MQIMTALGVIPARYRSERFPGKPLTPIAGRSMIEWVWRGARTARRLRDVVIATDDERIAEVCRGFGAKVAMTRADHPTGTDRIAEVAESLDDDILVNVQGDEPLIEGAAIDAVVDALLDAPDVPMSTLVHSLSPEYINDPNRVKVDLDDQSDARGFWRSTATDRENGRNGDGAARCWQHVGLYAYRRSFLLEFVSLPQSAGERALGLEQLRALENGHRIRCAVLDSYKSIPVDVPADVAAVEHLLKELQRS
jgi:3-deoxy-manno-octulosonate cytidylyltransferase (CMP-KDO synthetase)